MPIAHVTGNLGNCDKTWGKEQKEDKICLIWGGRGVVQKVLYLIFLFLKT